jgi:hypothetical protein
MGLNFKHPKNASQTNSSTQIEDPTHDPVTPKKYGNNGKQNSTPQPPQRIHRLPTTLTHATPPFHNISPTHKIITSQNSTPSRSPNKKGNKRGFDTQFCNFDVLDSITNGCMSQTFPNQKEKTMILYF